MWQQEDDMIKDEDELLERDIGAAILFFSFDKYLFEKFTKIFCNLDKLRGILVLQYYFRLLTNIFVWKFYKGFFKFWLLPI